MRMIDADKMLSGLKPVTYDMEHNAVTIADMSNIMRNWVCRQPTIPAAQWIRVEERLPGWSGDYICVSRDKNGREWVIPAEWSREMKTWFGRFGEIRNKVTHWMPLPEPPDKRYKCRYADDDGVCDKLSGNGEIIYCVEGPCPYDMPEGVWDDGAHIEPELR